jgi:hypothetical protein
MHQVRVRPGRLTAAGSALVLASSSVEAARTGWLVRAIPHRRDSRPSPPATSWGAAAGTTCSTAATPRRMTATTTS